MFNSLGSHRATISPHQQFASDDTRSLQVMFRCALALASVVTIGSLGFMLIEDWPVWKSIYFTLITITTVGYGDEGLSPYGKAYAAALVVGGIGVATYSLSLLVQTAVNYQFAGRTKMQDSIDHLEDHVLVCGFGRMGRAVCEQLIREDTSFVVVEPIAEICEQAESLGYLVVQGNAAEDGVLLQAGVERARALVCAAACDAENVFITLSSRELNSELFIVSRADGAGATRKLRRAGASLVVSPHKTAGSKVATTIARPYLSDTLEIGEASTDGFRMDEILVQEESSLIGQSVSELGNAEPQTVFVAIRRDTGEKIVRPKETVTFQANDTLVAVGTSEVLARVRTLANATPAYV